MRTEYVFGHNGTGEQIVIPLESDEDNDAVRDELAYEQLEEYLALLLRDNWYIDEVFGWEEQGYVLA